VPIEEEEKEEEEDVRTKLVKKFLLSLEKKTSCEGKTCCTGPF
jgi:hypothetical protein